MKWSIKYIVSALPFLFTACSGDWLDLDPSTSVTSDNAIQSLEDAKTALNGIYRIASEHSYYGDNYLYYADCRGEDVQARIDKGPGRRVSPYYLFNVAADDAFNITRVWNQPYIVIHQANSLIEKIDNGSVQTSDTQEIARIKAEALAMRGLALFDLTRLFGQSGCRRWTMCCPRPPISCSAPTKKRAVCIRTKKSMKESAPCCDGLR